MALFYTESGSKTVYGRYFSIFFVTKGKPLSLKGMAASNRRKKTASVGGLVWAMAGLDQWALQRLTMLMHFDQCVLNPQARVANQLIAAQIGKQYVSLAKTFCTRFYTVQKLLVFNGAKKRALSIIEPPCVCVCFDICQTNAG